MSVSLEAPPAQESSGRLFLLRVFYEPEAVFASIARRAATAQIVGVLAAITVCSIASQLLAISKIDQEALIRAQLEQRNMSEAQIEAALEVARPLVWIGPAAAIVSVPLVMAVLAALFLVGMNLAGSTADFRRVWAGIAHAYWPPTLVHSLAFVAIGLTQREIDPAGAGRLVKSNLGAFLPDAVNPALRTFSSFLDVFTIWTIVLTVLAVASVGSLSRARAAVVVLSFWSVWIVARVGLAAYFPMGTP